MSGMSRSFIKPEVSKYPEHPNREYIRWFKKNYKLNDMSNFEIRQFISNLKTTEKNEMIANLNSMITIDENELDFGDDEIEEGE